MRLAPTRRETVFRDGPARLLRFSGSGDLGAAPWSVRPVVMLVPSLIHRWYILDLRPGRSLVEALVAQGVDVFLLDWGRTGDEARYLTWDALTLRIARFARRARRAARVERISLLGYSVGGTLATIYATLQPERVSGLVNVAGPIDFSLAGSLQRLVDPRWLDSGVIAAAGNLSSRGIQLGFDLIAPAMRVAHALKSLARIHDRETRHTFIALERWMHDEVPFPALAWATLISELYQANKLVRGEHRVAGERVDLSRIRAPVMTVVPRGDLICPPEAALALHDHVGTDDLHALSIPGGHVGAVVGPTGPTHLYSELAAWLKKVSAGT